jgi:hypothetical protein
MDDGAVDGIERPESVIVLSSVKETWGIPDTGSGLALTEVPSFIAAGEGAHREPIISLGCAARPR